MEKHGNHHASYRYIGRGRTVRRVVGSVFWLVLVSCLLLGLPDAAQANVSIELSFAQLVRRTTVVVVGTVAESRTFWESGSDAHSRLVTYHRFVVDRVVAGELDGSETWVRCLGGRQGNIAQRVEGEAILPSGQRLLLFLGANNSGTSSVVGMAQGAWLLERGQDGVERVRATPHRGMLIPCKESPSAESVLGGRTLQEAVGAVTAARPSHVR